MTTPSLAPEPFGADTNALIEHVLAQTNLTDGTFWIQIGCIAFAILFGWFIAKQTGNILKILALKWAGLTLTHRGIRFALDLVRRLMLSVFCALFLFIIVYIVQGLNFLPSDTHLQTLTLAYRAFYAWAVFVIVECLTVLFDTQHLHPKIKSFFYICFWSLAFLQIFGILSPIVSEMKSITLPLGSEKLTLWTLLILSLIHI